MSEDRLPKAVRPRHAAWPVAGLAVLWLSMLTVGAGPVDGELLRLLYAGDQPAIAALARTITMLGDGPVVILLAVAGAAGLLWGGAPRRGFALIAVTLVGRLLVSAQKYSIQRLRPGDHDHLIQVSNPSFPSGHAANSMILWLALALILFGDTRHRKLAIAAALTLALLVGTSRVVLGVHWPTDVIGGWAFGLMWVLLALPVAERLFGPRR